VSAILGDSGNSPLGPDGIARYHTTCKVLVHSHNQKEVIDLSADTVAIHTSKSVKAIGQAAVMITPSQNYLNLIQPNDYINIYFDLGDGNGPVRTFFGLVDRIEETYEVDRQGKPSTSYRITASDFQKIFDKTNIYFNPHLRGRDDVIGDVFGTANIGGVALATRGIELHGSPADIVQNVLLLMLGFGTQFLLPTSYNPAPPFSSRKQLLNYVESGLTPETRKNIMDAGGFEKFLRDQKIDAAIEAGTDIDEPGARDTLRTNLQEQLKANPANSANFGPGIVNVLPGVTERDPALLDVLNLFDFIEIAAIDGYTSATTLWTQTGPITSILRTFSNEIVNELFFDLRPLSVEADEEYLRIPDEIGGNVSGETGKTGVTHVPAVVMREYPFGTIEEYDGAGIQLNIKDSAGSLGLLGNVPMGALFSNEFDKAGRHLIPFPAISYSDQVRGKSISVANRILDVAVVRTEEIKKTNFGRSDHDHVNLIETTTEDGLLGAHAKYFMQDLQPITTPIHIMRNGLRLRSVSTRFARYAPATVGSLAPTEDKPDGVTNSEVANATRTKDLKVDGTFSAPIVGGGTNQKPSRYGYRLTSSKGPSGSNLWKFHNGVDLFAPVGTNVYAIADGVVVCSSPKGGLKYYSQSIIIKHPGLGPGGVDLFSQYSHLSAKDPSMPHPAEFKFKNFMSKSLIANGTMPEIPVKAGQLIGQVGNEKGTPSNPEAKFAASRAHLHFELLVKAAGKVYPAKFGSIPAARKRAIEDFGVSVFEPTRPQHGVDGDTPHLDPEGKALTKGDFPLERQNQRTIDPIAFFAAQDPSINIVDESRAFSGPDPVIPADETEMDEPEEQEDDSAVAKPEPAKPTVEALLDAAASGATPLESKISGMVPFKQLARWSLLQDHWYQHNTEYLSGTIDMRGAPEIRVGYRLDLPDRSMSFYIEGVNHSWQFPNDMTSTLQVTRGQTSNPYPLYVPPVPFKTQGKDGNSRLAKFFLVPDPLAVQRAVVLRGSGYERSPIEIDEVDETAKYLPEETIIADTFATETLGLSLEERLPLLEAIDSAAAAVSGLPTPQANVDGIDSAAGVKKRRENAKKFDKIFRPFKKD
jgi:murein DD-endopeptidase MepM/ murein hydrolase activator NlpD